MALASKKELQDLIAQLNHAAENYDETDSVSGFKSRTAIIEKAKAITHTMVSPMDMSFSHTLNMAELIAIRTLIKLKALEAIPPTGSISLQDLAAATKAQPSLLERMLRCVVGTGFLDQVSHDGGDYKHTKFSLAYTSIPGTFFQAIYDEYFKSMVCFDDYLTERGDFSEPDEITRNPYTWRHKMDGTNLWAIMASYPERFQAFQVGIAGSELSVPVVGFYDFGKLKSSQEGEVEIVDVGGGQGGTLGAILKAHPELDARKIVLQDTGEVLELAAKSAFVPKEVVKMKHDFWTENPVKGAKAYYIRRVLHDYSDAANVIILSQIAKAMSPDSLVLVADMVMPARVHEENLPAATMDNIMFTLGGKERTEEMFKALFDEAGLELVQIYTAPVGAGGVVEGRLKR